VRTAVQEEHSVGRATQSTSYRRTATCVGANGMEKEGERGGGGDRVGFVRVSNGF
jgi:hypothetical protein